MGNKCLYDYEPVLAMADIIGSNKYPDINGRVVFKKKGEGVLVTAEIMGLPVEDGKCDKKIFGFHIHVGKSCESDDSEEFKLVGEHYNPDECKHPSHAGDLPPLFGNNGYAYMCVYTGRFTITEIIGRTVIIHGMADDFITQPSGNAGEKIACGEIVML